MVSHISNDVHLSDNNAVFKMYKAQSTSLSVKSRCVCDDDAKICVRLINFPYPFNNLAGKASDM